MTQETPPLPTLPMQLMLSLGCWLSSPFALQCAKSVWPPSSSNLKSLPENLALQKAIAEEAKNRATSLLKGILRYYDTPYAHSVSTPPCIWQRGNARLLDYGLKTAGGNQPVVLFIPSLINRYYILDLEEKRSLLRFIATQGIYPLVLDWGEPGNFEQSFNCGDYITEILNAAIDFIASSAGSRIVLAGYCMGGNLALAAAQLQRKHVSALALLATPWDFHCKAFLPFVIDKKWLPMVDKMVTAQKTLPAEIIQSLFYMTDPWVFEHKFRRFAGLDPKSRETKEFVSLEHWVNDGVPMTANVARDCLIDWAQENNLANGKWQVAGQTIDPKKIKMPTFIAMPESDHVVPRDCAAPLAKVMPHAQVTHPSAGHVGMIVGSHAKEELWQPLADWILTIS